MSAPRHACVLVLCIGCSVGVGDEPFGTAGVEPASSDDESPFPDWDIPPDAGDASSDDGEPNESSTGDEDPQGCAAIDVLVVVESPASDDWTSDVWAYAGYAAYYERLAEGLATLVDGLAIEAGVVDVRVLVTGSMPADALCELNSCGAGCLGVEADACDTALGAGRNGFVIPEYGVTECAAGRFVEPGQLDAGSLQCLVRGTGLECGPANYNSAGPDTLWDALALAVDAQAQPGGCNAGFLRDDALLVTVLVAPAQDPIVDASVTTAAAAHERVVAAKGGDESRVVTLALGGNVAGEYAWCESEVDAELPEAMRDVVETSTYGAWDSACLDDFGSFFAAGATTVATACAAFDP